MGRLGFAAAAQLLELDVSADLLGWGVAGLGDSRLI